MTAGRLVLRQPWRVPALLDLFFAARRAEPLPDVDPELVRQAQRGDASAFADLVRHYEPRLRALASRLLEDRDLTDDALQEAYVRAFKALGRFRGDSSLGTWLYRITYNACIDELRRGRRVVPCSPISSPTRSTRGPDRRSLPWRAATSPPPSPRCRQSCGP